MTAGRQRAQHCATLARTRSTRRYSLRNHQTYTVCTWPLLVHQGPARARGWVPAYTRSVQHPKHTRYFVLLETRAYTSTLFRLLLGVMKIFVFHLVHAEDAPPRLISANYRRGCAWRQDRACVSWWGYGYEAASDTSSLQALAADWYPEHAGFRPGCGMLVDDSMRLGVLWRDVLLRMSRCGVGFDPVMTGVWN